MIKGILCTVGGAGGGGGGPSKKSGKVRRHFDYLFFAIFDSVRFQINSGVSATGC